MIFLDIETRAPTDKMVTDVGLYAHAPHAKLLGMRYRLAPGEPLQEWRGYFADGETPDCSDAPPRDLIEAVKGGAMLCAHNAGYERVVLEQSPHVPWWPTPPITQWVCSASWAAAFNLPRGLGPLSKMLLPADQAKMVEVATGVKYMWDESREMFRPEDMDTQMKYCGGDVTAMEAVMALLPAVDPDWLAGYHASEAINDRGVMIDRTLADAIVEMKPRIDADLLDDLERATGGGVKLRGPSLLNWLKAQLGEDLDDALIVNRKVRHDYGFRTEKKVSADKTARAQVLAAIEEVPGFEHVRRALAAFDEANKAATTKFAAAIRRVSDDDILRGQFVYGGAGQTGRFSSFGVQVHNLKREVSPKAVEIIDTITEHFGHPGVIAQRFGMSVNDCASQVLRPLFIAPEGRLLYWGDWSAIEARMLPWLTADDSAEEVLDVFRAGGDIYVRQAASILRIDEAEVTKEQRQSHGKVPILSLGYQGGVGAFQSMARNYGVEMTDAEADAIKVAWRNANPWAQTFWWDLERDAMEAVRANDASRVFPVGRVTYQYLPGLVGGTLLCWLPSGHWVAYPQARVRDIEKYEGSPAEPALTFLHPTYGPSATYGGAQAENVTQAECAALLRRALIACEAEGLETVLHIHDEIVGEADADAVEEDAGILEEIMNDVPTTHWGLPLDAEVQIGDRYKIERID